MSKAQPIADPDIDAKLDAAFGDVKAAEAVGIDFRPTVSAEEYAWLQRMKASNYQEVTAAPEMIVIPPRIPPTLAEALAVVQADIPEVKKAEEGEVKKDGVLQYKYSYADLAAVTKAILPKLGAVGLSWVTMPTMVDGKFMLVYRLMHASGESLEGMYPLPTGASAQATGSAITYARRYCLCSVTGIAPGDDDDAAEAQAAHQAAQAKPAPPKGLSSFERETGMMLLYPPSAEQRTTAGLILMRQSFRQALDFSICLDEHQAWDASPIRDGASWRQLFSDRITDEINAADSGEELNNVWAALKAAKLLIEPISAQIKERAAAIKERNAKAYDTIVQQVTTATLDDLEAARLSITQALHLGRLTQQQHTELCELHAERAQRLERDRNEAAPNG